jgi:hypothetical protein
MSLLNAAKLLLKKKIEMAKANARFRINLALEKLFFSIPSKIELLKLASLTTLQLIMKNLLSGGYPNADIKNFIRSDPRVKSIINFTSTDFNESALSDILLACYSENPDEFLPEINENMDAQDILKTVSKLNDIDKKVSKNKVKRLISTIKNDINRINALKKDAEAKIAQIAQIGSQVLAVGALLTLEKDKLRKFEEDAYTKLQSYRYLLQHIVSETQILFTKSYHPSRYRTKYLQKLIRNTYALLKDEVDQTTKGTKQQYNKIMDALKQIDDILVAMALVTTLYITNRIKLSNRSKQTLDVLTKDIICERTEDSFDVMFNRRPFQMTLACPVDTDEIVVPHEPISEKLNNFSCEIKQIEEVISDGEAREDLATIAIIRNNKEKETLNVLTTINSTVTQKNIIANIGLNRIYSPVNGIIDKITKNEIIIRDISDPVDNYLNTQIDLLNKKHERLNYIKSFLKEYYIESLYPVMLTISATDVSVFNTLNVLPENPGVEHLFNNIKNDFSRINENYENRVKNITGKDNVEKHARNESLNKIKDELEKKQIIFYKNVKLLGKTAENRARSLEANAHEYELFEYYITGIGMSLNALDKPNEVEKKFRDKINQYIQKRYIADRYNKDKVADKINDLTKQLKGGALFENWFDKAMQVYLPEKSLDKLKNWLTKLADENKELDNAKKTSLINSILFLFQLYVNADNLLKKQKIFKQVTLSSKKETIIEGNYIHKFTTDLWKEYLEIPREIKSIEKIIDSLSLFTTYSITEYEGKQARLYSLADEPKCESSETDPYLNPKSKKQFSDIDYWMKYCSFATLASALNPLGWSTGWIVPSPILFPVIYIPIKAITTKTGVTVIGLSICGIWLFPWTLFANLSTRYTTPFGDPTAILTKEIEALKKEISEQIVSLKKSVIKPLLDKTKKDVKDSQDEVKKLKKQLKQYRSEKPSKRAKISSLTMSAPEINKGNGKITPKNIKSTTKDVKNAAKNVSDTVENAKELAAQNLAYIAAYKEWTQKMATTTELIVTQSIKTWKLQIKCSIMQEAYDTGKSLKGITEALDATEKFMTAQLDKLESMVETINKTLSALPISLAPETANFAMTVKNTKPIINIADELDDNVNTGVLDKFLESFRLKNSDMLNSNYSNKLSNSIINFNKYKTELSAIMTLLILKDAFPKYENLKITNVAWQMFLNTEFIVEGARTYGFPNQLPTPINT